MDEDSSQRGQGCDLKGAREHDAVLQPKKVSSPGVSPWRLSIS